MKGRHCQELHRSQILKNPDRKNSEKMRKKGTESKKAIGD